MVLAGVNLDIAASSHHAIVGPNGSGKSSLLAALIGSPYLAAGSLLYDGVSFRQHRRPAEVRTLVAQTHEAHPDLRVEQAVALYCGRIVVETDVGFGVANLWRKRLGELSAGQLARVFLAAAFSANARVILLDEPTAALDGEAIGVLADATVQHLDRGGSIVTVTHDVVQCLPHTQVHNVSAWAAHL